jgi:Cu+-exporting ATPase
MNPMNSAPATATFTDPVCGMKVNVDSAAGKAEFRGTTFYFCSEHCWQKFEASPEAFVKPEAVEELSHSRAAKSAPGEHSCCGGDSPHHHARPT